MHMVTLTSSYERDSGLWGSWCNAKLFKAIWTGLRTLLLSGYKVSTRKKKNSEGSTAEEEANISNFDAAVFFEVTVS